MLLARTNRARNMSSSFDDAMKNMLPKVMAKGYELQQSIMKQPFEGVAGGGLVRVTIVSNSTPSYLSIYR